MGAAPIRRRKRAGEAAAAAGKTIAVPRVASRRGHSTLAMEVEGRWRLMGGATVVEVDGRSGSGLLCGLGHAIETERMESDTKI